MLSFNLKPSSRKEERQNNEARQFVLNLLSQGITGDDLYNECLLEFDVDSCLNMVVAGVLPPIDNEINLDDF